MPLFSGANRSKHVPKGNNSPFSNRNNLPKGRANGSWVPSNKDPGKRANSYEAKEFSKQGRPKSNGYSFSGGGSKGQPSPFFGGQRTVHNTRARLHGTTLDINTRGTTPHLKAKTAVSASAISKVGTAIKVVSAAAIAKVLAVTAFILNATAEGTSDGTLPDYIGQPGETQTISEPPPPAPYGYTITFYSTNNRKWITWEVKSYKIFKNPPNDRYPDAIEAIFLDESFGSVNLDPSTLTKESLPYPKGQEPEPLPPNNSESTSNHSNVKPEPKGKGFPSGVRPPFPSDRTSNPTPSTSFTKPKSSKSSVVKQAVAKTPKGNIETNNNLNTNNNNFPTPVKQQSKLEAPSEIPEPVPVPLPPKEKTLEEVEQPEVIKTPKIISDTLSRRADGTTQRTIVREATEEELKEFKERGEQIKVIRNSSVTTNQRTPSVSKKTTSQPVPEPDQTPTTQTSTTPTTPTKQTPTVDDPIKDKIDKLPTVDDIAIAVAGLDIIKQIAQKAGTANPICQAEGLRPAINRNNDSTGLARVAILGQGQVTQIAVNTANSTLTHPTWGLQAIVTNANYGLEKIQGYASTAWKATRADKIVNALNTLLIVHNAMMLSNNIASTTSEALNLGLEAIGIRDEEDKPIDIGGAVKGKLTSILQNWIGEEKYRQLTLRLASANRIYQSGANIVYGLRNVFDAGQYLVENISENVSFIGNALRRDGVVRENSYRLMPTDVNSTSRLLYRLEAANDVVDIIEEIASDAKDITEEIGELKENQKQFEEELEKVFKKDSTEETNTKNYATSTLEPLEEDEFRGVKNGD